MNGRFSFCTPAKAGAATGAAVGLVVWALVAFVPAFHNGVPQPVVDFLPFALAWLGHAGAAWIAPHKPVPAATLATPSGSPGVTFSPAPEPVEPRNAAGVADALAQDPAAGVVTPPPSAAPPWPPATTA